MVGIILIGATVWEILATPRSSSYFLEDLTRFDAPGRRANSIDSTAYVMALEASETKFSVLPILFFGFLFVCLCLVCFFAHGAFCNLDTC